MLDGRHFGRFTSILLAIAISGVIDSSFSAPAMAASFPPNDFFAFANVVSAQPYSDLGVDTTLATTETNEPASSCYQVAPPAGPFNTVWYKYVPSATTTVSASAIPSGIVRNRITPVVVAYEGTDLTSLIERGCVVASAENAAAHLALPVTAGHTYYLQVGGRNAEGPTEIFDFTLSGPRSAVTLYASSTSVRRGSSVTLSGSVRPSHPGARVTIQRKLNGTWRTFATVRLSSASTYRYVVVTRVAGTFVLRASVAAQANPSVLSGTSASRTFRVR